MPGLCQPQSVQSASVKICFPKKQHNTFEIPKYVTGAAKEQPAQPCPEGNVPGMQQEHSNNVPGTSQELSRNGPRNIPGMPQVKMPMHNHRNVSGVLGLLLHPKTAAEPLWQFFQHRGWQKKLLLETSGCTDLLMFANICSFFLLKTTQDKGICCVSPRRSETAAAMLPAP